MDQSGGMKADRYVVARNGPKKVKSVGPKSCVGQLILAVGLCIINNYTEPQLNLH